MNKAQLVALFGAYEKGLASKARNKSAENAFVSGLYSFYGKTRPDTSNNIGHLGKKSQQNFNRNIRSLINVLKLNGPNANKLATANRQARQTALNYYYGLTPNAVNRVRTAMTSAAKFSSNLAAKQARVAANKAEAARIARQEAQNAANEARAAVSGAAATKSNKNARARANAAVLAQKVANAKAATAAAEARAAAHQAATAAAPSSFYAMYPMFATGSVRSILNRTTNTKKRFQVSRNPSLTASNAQFQILKSKSPNGTYYGNMNIWKKMNITKYTNLTDIQKNALRRSIRSVRLNSLEPNKSKVRAGLNREELTNDLMKITSNRNLIAIIKRRVAKSRASTEWAPNASATSTASGAPTSLFTSSTSTNWRNYNK